MSFGQDFKLFLQAFNLLSMKEWKYKWSWVSSAYKWKFNSIKYLWKSDRATSQHTNLVENLPSEDTKVQNGLWKFDQSNSQPEKVTSFVFWPEINIHEYEIQH